MDCTGSAWLKLQVVSSPELVDPVKKQSLLAFMELIWLGAGLWPLQVSF